jgi:hypothetical protein
MKLRVRAMGLTLGVALGLAAFVATEWAVFEGRGSTIGLLRGYFAGFSVTLGGAFLGFIWGFVYGFILGALVAWLYNTFCRALYRAEISVK